MVLGLELRAGHFLGSILQLEPAPPSSLSLLVKLVLRKHIQSFMPHLTVMDSNWEFLIARI
jgi:hypothetical protein